MSNLPSDQSDMQPVKKEMKQYRSFGFGRRNQKDNTTAQPTMMNPENKITGINFPRNVPGNLPGNIPNIPAFKPAPGPPTGINIGSFQDTTAKFKMPTSLTNIYSIDTGNSATCNLPSYKTHGLGHNVTHRPNNGYQPIPSRGGRGRGGNVVG